MPVQVTYPGVYIEEIPSGVQTITGVATSITAFMGTALCGPLGYDPVTHEANPITIFSFTDYQRIFGGLWVNSPMSYAVRDFFLNGGSQAIIVRLYEPTPASPAANEGKATIYVNPPASPPSSPPTADDWVAATPALNNTLTLEASSPGTWGNYVRVMADANDISDKVVQLYINNGVTQVSDLFNLTIFYNPPGGQMQIERFINLSVKDNPSNPNPNRVDRVLNQQSQYVYLAPANLPTSLDPNWIVEWSNFYNELQAEGYNQSEIYELLELATGGDDGQQYPEATTYSDAGMKALDSVDLFNLLCIPYDTTAIYAADAEKQAMEAYADLVEYCQLRRAMLIVDPPMSWTNDAKQYEWSKIQPTDVDINGLVERNAAVYFPRVVEADPLLKGLPRTMPACGIIAGVMASTDVTRGVWKAPAGIDAGLNGILSLELTMTDAQNGLLNPLGINCLRSFPVIGPVVWGARTLRGADQLEDDYKYIPVRRLTLYIEESLYRGTKWAVFEPNADPLWTSLRLSVNSFLSDLQRQGAFYSYFVQCDSKTTTADYIALGIVNVIVGIAPVKPAEFVIIQIQQTAGQTS
ncbi:MAG: uncharacterized protein QOC96_1622 [Acidobacteriota bacterium]|jgi:phage tail sheath protein FI|nr:uncharacterized protein [Acidobacteriota bacterium]